MLPDDDLDTMRMARMRWNTPLSEEHAGLLLQRLAIEPGARILDLGCGWGELLLRAVAAADGATGVGVDVGDEDLERGRRLAEQRSLAERVAFVHGDAKEWRDPADRVLCIGASHAFDGTEAALGSLAGLVAPGGRVLYGDIFWQRPPGEQAVEFFGDQTTDLAGLAERAVAAGWRVLHLSVADQREWDDFEASWRLGRQEWLLRHPGDPGAAEVREEVDRQLREYLGVYRGVAGMAYLVLGR